MSLSFSVFYWVTHSQKGLRWTFSQFEHLIPGKFKWDHLEIGFLSRTLEIKNLGYELPHGEKILELQELKAKLRWDSLFRLRGMFKEFTVKGLRLDLSSLPPRKGPSPIPKVLRVLTRRLAFENAQLTDFHLKLKNDSFQIPHLSLYYWPSLIGKDKIKLKTENIEGILAKQVFRLESLQYEGAVSLPEMIRQLFLFRQATGLLALKGFEWGPWQLSDLTTQADFDGETIDFKGFDFTVGQGNYHLKLKLSPFSQQAKGNLSSVGFLDPKEIPGLRPKPARVYHKAEFSFDFDLTGFNFKEMEGKIALNLKARENQINPETPTLAIDLASQIDKGRFQISALNIQNEKTKMAAKGEVDLVQMKLNVAVSGTGFDLLTFVGFFADLELHAYADFAGDIQGDLKNPEFRFKVQGHDTGYKFLRFGESEGIYEIVNGQMRYIGASPPGAAYQDTINITTTDLFKKERRHSLKATFNHIDVSSLLENPKMTGKIEGTYELEAQGDHNKGKISALIKAFHLYQFNLGDMNVEGAHTDHSFNLPGFTFQPPQMEKILAPKETAFRFSETGFDFKGSPLEGMEVEGKYIYARKNILDTKLTCHRCALSPLLAVLEKPNFKGSVSGKVDMQLVLGNFENSKVETNLEKIEIPVGETLLTAAEPIKIAYRQGAFHFDQVALSANENIFRILGIYVPEKPIDLQVIGDVDLSLLKIFREHIREGSGKAKVDLKMRGKLEAPLLTGTVDFNRNTLSLRSFPQSLEELKGRITIDDQKISTDQLEASISDGDLKIQGALWHDHLKIKKADLKAEAREIGYSSPGNYKLILSGKLGLTGEAPNLVLAGNLDITEGRYIKNFDLREFILKPAPTETSLEKGKGFESLKLDLKIKSPGDLVIRNNLAEIYLKSDLHITGSKENPLYEGNIEVLEGKFNYFKINFEDAKGFINLKNHETYPYVDITAQKLFEKPSGNIRVEAHIQGYTDNLRLTFASDPPYEKREILALIFTGALPEEKQSISGSSLASTVVASQLTSVLSQPVTGFTRLDIFRLEASDPDAKSLTSLVVGKKITDRLSLEFKTDLAIDESIKSIQAEYVLFDNVLLKGARSSTGRYRFDFTFRFKGY